MRHTLLLLLADDAFIPYIVCVVQQRFGGDAARAHGQFLASDGVRRTAPRRRRDARSRPTAARFRQHVDRVSAARRALPRLSSSERLAQRVGRHVAYGSRRPSSPSWAACITLSWSQRRGQDVHTFYADSRFHRYVRGAPTTRPCFIRRLHVAVVHRVDGVVVPHGGA